MEIIYVNIKIRTERIDALVKRMEEKGMKIKNKTSAVEFLIDQFMLTNPVKVEVAS